MHIIVFDNDGNIIGYLPDDPAPGGGLVAQETAPVFGPHGIIVPEEDHPPRKMYLDVKMIAKGLGLDKHEKK